jgi:hypothetical protein
MISQLKRTLLSSALLIATLSAKAQVNITEYFQMSKAFQIDLQSRSSEKTIYTKGILNIDWKADRRILAVTYDPRQTTINDAMRHILAQTGGNIERESKDEEQLSKNTESPTRGGNEEK